MVDIRVSNALTFTVDDSGIAPVIYAHTPLQSAKLRYKIAVLRDSRKMQRVYRDIKAGEVKCIADLYTSMGSTIELRILDKNATLMK